MPTRKWHWFIGDYMYDVMGEQVELSRKYFDLRDWSLIVPETKPYSIPDLLFLAGVCETHLERLFVRLYVRNYDTELTDDRMRYLRRVLTQLGFGDPERIICDIQCLLKSDQYRGTDDIL